MYLVMHKTRGYCIGPGGWDTHQEALHWLWKNCRTPLDFMAFEVVRC